MLQPAQAQHKNTQKDFDEQTNLKKLLYAYFDDRVNSFFSTCFYLCH